MTSSSPATDSPSLIESFEPLEDPRHGEIYPLEEIVVLVICATISGADTFVAAQQFGEARQEWLRGLLPFEKGIPSHDVLSGVFGRIDPVQFEDCFRSWVHSMHSKEDRRGSGRHRRKDLVWKRGRVEAETGPPEKSLGIW
jgi:hypothetical protein